MSETIKVVIVDSHPMMREGLRAAIERSGDIRVVAQAGDGYAAVLVSSTHKADLVILEADMTQMDTHETVLRLRSQLPKVSIIISFDLGNYIDVPDLVQAGASGFVSRSAEAGEFINAIRAVVPGGTYFSKMIAATIFSRQARGGQHASALAGLTEREVEVLRFIGQGFSNKDIARRLQLSVRTVETHRLNIRKKTKASRLKELLHLARKIGGAPLPEVEAEGTLN